MMHDLDLPVRTPEQQRARRDLIQQKLRRNSASGLRPAARSGGFGSVPLSFVQERMWFLTQLEPDAPTYNNSRLCLRIKGRLDVAILEKALNHVLQRHEILRTRFPSIAGVPVQVVSAWEYSLLHVQDLSSLGGADQENGLNSLARTVVLQRYDLEKGPLVRMALARLSDFDHVLLLGFHHIVFDVWSKQVLQEELRICYSALACGEQLTLAPLPLQYGDFAVWQREQAGERHGVDLAYWRGVLEGELPVLNLPTANPRPEQPHYRGGRLEKLIERRRITELERTAKAEGVTLFMVLLATYAVLLQRYTDQDDFIIGCPVAGRLHPEVEPLIGCFVNTLPVRIRLNGGHSFRELLHVVRSSVLGAFDHQALPFEKLVEALNPPRVMNRAPIVQTLFNVRNVPAAASRWGELEVSSWDFDDGIAQFDLAMEFDDIPEGLRLVVRFDLDLFEREAIGRIVSHYVNLLDQFVDVPGEPVCLVPMLSPFERHQLLIERNNTTVDYPAHECIHELFEAQVRRTPDRIAVLFGDARLTYRELDHRANEVAAYLQNLGAGPETLVALYFERSLSMVVSVLGVLKAGAAYVALDPAYPFSRLAFLLRDSQARFILTERDLSTRLPPSSAKVIPFSTVTATGSPAKTAKPSNLAYLIYTSGSTGIPKGVAVEHRNTVAFLYWARDAFGTEELAGVLAGTSLCFDLSVFELFAPLCWGGTVLLVRDILELSTNDTRRPVRLINTVPSAMAELLRAGRLPATACTVNLAGEALKQELVEKLYAVGVKRVYDLYGPSETTTYSTWGLRQPKGCETIGRPLSNTQVYILDKHRQLAPIGVPGELYIGGSGVTRGYWQRPDLTADRFLPDLFGTEPHGRLYRTGDRCRWNHEGTLEFLGRLDNQVKIRGYRIELGEVETALGECPGIAQGIVLSRPDAIGNQQLVAYIVPEHGTSVDVFQVRAALKHQLPDHMLPSAFLTLQTLPLTPNGKVDRKALRKFEVTPMSPAAYQEPRDETEKALIDIWADLLQVHRIGIHDNFFDIGGHSLLATRVVARVQEMFNWRMPLATLFLSPTIESLARAITEGKNKERRVALVPIQSSGTKNPLYFVHGWGGQVGGFMADLARELGPDQPVYGLRAVQDEHGKYLHDRVQHMAVSYVDEIVASRAAGPYNLVGHSIGGWLAWAVADELRKRGGSVGVLALLDTTLNCQLPWSVYLASLASYLPMRFAFHCRRFRSLTSGQRREYFARRMVVLRNLLLMNRRGAGAAEKPRQHECAPAEGNLVDFIDLVVHAYKPSHYAGPVHLFASEERDVTRVVGVLRRLARGGVTIRRVPGGHLSMVGKENIGALAAALGDVLREAQPQSS